MTEDHFVERLDDLQKLSQGEILEHANEVERIGRRYLFRGQWDEAQEVYQQLVTAGRRDLRWIVRKLQWRIERRSSFRALYGNDVHQERMIDFWRRKGQAVAAIESRRGSVGYVGAAAFVHRLVLTGQDHVLEIYEKVFEGTDTKNVERELLLFSHHPAHELLAPELHGIDRVGDFISAYYTNISGPEVTREDWRELQVELIQRFWSLSPDRGITGSELSNRLTALTLFTTYEDLQILPVLRGTFGHAEIEALVRRITDRRATIMRSIEEMPLFVFHRDLHAGNTIRRDDGRVFVVDWEQWSLEPVGFGWLPYLQQSAPMRIPDMPTLRQRRPELREWSTAHVLLMASLWGLAVASRDQRPELGIAWLERIVKYAEEIHATSGH